MNHRTDMERIAALEAEVKQLKHTVETHRVEAREDRERMFTLLDGIKTDIARHVPCPAPGACIRLESEIKQHADVLNKLNDAHNQRTGERAIVAAIASVIGGVLVSIAGWLLGRHQ